MNETINEFMAENCPDWLASVIRSDKILQSGVIVKFRVLKLDLKMEKGKNKMTCKCLTMKIVDLVKKMNFIDKNLSDFIHLRYWNEYIKTYIAATRLKAKQRATFFSFSRLFKDFRKFSFI